jgi:hypothetical protein
MRSDALLWIVQGLLALIFLFAGGMKMVLPPETLGGPMPLPHGFIGFIGVALTAMARRRFSRRSSGCALRDGGVWPMSAAPLR